MTRRVPQEILHRLEKHFVVRRNDDDVLLGSSLVQHAKGCFGILSCLTETINKSVLSELPDLQIVSNMAVGTNNIDLAYARERRIMVTNTPDVLTESTADLGVALMLATARRVTEAEAFLRRGEWKVWSFDLLSGFDLSGSTVGIVGFGRIGQVRARMEHVLLFNLFLFIRQLRSEFISDSTVLFATTSAGPLQQRSSSRRHMTRRLTRCWKTRILWCWFCRIQHKCTISLEGKEKERKKMRIHSISPLLRDQIRKMKVCKSFTLCF